MQTIYKLAPRLRLGALKIHLEFTYPAHLFRIPPPRRSYMPIFGKSLSHQTNLMSLPSTKSKKDASADQERKRASLKYKPQKRK